MVVNKVDTGRFESHYEDHLSVKPYTQGNMKTVETLEDAVASLNISPEKLTVVRNRGNSRWSLASFRPVKGSKQLFEVVPEIEFVRGVLTNAFVGSQMIRNAELTGCGAPMQEVYIGTLTGELMRRNVSLKTNDIMHNAVRAAFKPDSGVFQDAFTSQKIMGERLFHTAFLMPDGGNLLIPA